MPRAVWGIDRNTIDSFDRSKQFTPYTGQLPPVWVVYKWKITRMHYAAASGGKNAQLRVGLELVPRNPDERKYGGYSITLFRPLTNNNAFTYVPLLDVLGVSSRDFTEKTIVDSEGKIKRIGKWRNDGTQELVGQLTEKEDDKNVMRRDLAWIGSVPEDDEDYDIEDNDEDEYDDAPDDEDELGF